MYGTVRFVRKAVPTYAPRHTRVPTVVPARSAVHRARRRRRLHAVGVVHRGTGRHGLPGGWTGHGPVGARRSLDYPAAARSGRVGPAYHRALRHSAAPPAAGRHETARRAPWANRWTD